MENSLLGILVLGILVLGILVFGNSRIFCVIAREQSRGSNLVQNSV